MLKLILFTQFFNQFVYTVLYFAGIIHLEIFNKNTSKRHSAEVAVVDIVNVDSNKYNYSLGSVGFKLLS